MRSACAIGLGLALLFASGSARAQEELSKAKPSPSVTIIVIEVQPGVTVGPVRAGVPTGLLTGWTLMPDSNIPAAGGTTGKVSAPSPVSPIAGPFQAMDTNKDGKISQSEFKGPGDVFASVDANHDGYITRPEATRYLAFIGLLSLHEKAREFRTMDTNKDGKISQAEFKGSTAHFAHLDANHDGLITREEAIEAFSGRVRRAMHVARLRSMDANHDGLISASEFKGPNTAFARLDVNHDGMINRAELAQVYRAARSQHVAQATKPIATAPKVAAVTTTKTVTPVPITAVSQGTTPVTVEPWTKRILALDANKDGKVCKAEYLKGLEARFAYLDQDKDGYITAADLTKVVQARKTNPAPAPKPVATGKPAKTATGQSPAKGVKTAGVVKKS